MKLPDLLGPSLIVFTIFLFAHNAIAATCTSIEDFGSVTCTGAGGCTGERPGETCFFGCTCGQCNPRGSSGSCCGRIYYVPNIYGGSGCGSCGECGAARTHIRDYAAGHSNETKHSGDLRQDYSPG